MVAWGIERCKEEGVCAYLESTIEAVPFYKRLGFEPVIEISLDISGRLCEEGAVGQEYNEVGMIYRPEKILRQDNDIRESWDL